MPGPSQSQASESQASESRVLRTHAYVVHIQVIALHIQNICHPQALVKRQPAGVWFAHRLAKHLPAQALQQAAGRGGGGKGCQRLCAVYCPAWLPERTARQSKSIVACTAAHPWQQGPRFSNRGGGRQVEREQPGGSQRRVSCIHCWGIHPRVDKQQACRWQYRRRRSREGAHAMQQRSCSTSARHACPVSRLSWHAAS